jgi:hypothetical protein
MMIKITYDPNDLFDAVEFLDQFTNLELGNGVARVEIEGGFTNQGDDEEE